MTSSQDKTLQIIFEAVDEVNEMLPEEKRLEKSVDTVLAGDSGNLDSLGLVSFIVAVEGAAQRHFGQDLALADKMDVPDGPLTSIGTLAAYIGQQSGHGDA